METLRVLLIRFCEDLDLVGDHKRAVKSDSELSNDGRRIAARSGFFFPLFQEGLINEWTKIISVEERSGENEEVELRSCFSKHLVD